MKVWMGDKFQMVHECFENSAGGITCRDVPHEDRRVKTAGEVLASAHMRGADAIRIVDGAIEVIWYPNDAEIWERV